MLFFLVFGCVALFASVSCIPRPIRAGADPASDVDNHLELPLDQKVKYHYQYGVTDAASGVFSHKWEERLGSYVKGAYSMMQADGRIRTVDYEVDGPKGFHAVVRTSLPGIDFLSTQQLRQSRDSNPNPPVNVLTNNIPSAPVLEPRTPRLIHKDLPPNFHSVKPDYYWGSAPGGHAAKHQHGQDGAVARRARNRGDNRDTLPGTHSSYRTPGRGGSDYGFDDAAGNVAYEARRIVGRIQNGAQEANFINSNDGYVQNTNFQNQGRGNGQYGRSTVRSVQDNGDSEGRAQNTRSHYAQQGNVQRFSHKTDFRGENRDTFVNSRQTKGRRQESDVGNFVGGVDDGLSGMLPPRKNAVVTNYDHLLRAGKITDVLYL